MCFRRHARISDDTGAAHFANPRGVALDAGLLMLGSVARDAEPDAKGELL